MNAADDFMAHDMGRGGPQRTCPRPGRTLDSGNALASGGRASPRKKYLQHGLEAAAWKTVRAAEKNWPGAENSLPHDMAGLRPATLRYRYVRAAGKN